MLGFMTPSAEKTFFDDFASLSLRNAVPSGTNALRNSDGYGAAVGTNLNGNYDPFHPERTVPENWGVFPVSGLQIDLTAIGSTTINGQTCRTITFRAFGTTAANSASYITLDQDYVIRVSPGQTWTASAHLAYVSAGTNLTNITFGIVSDHWTDAYAWVSEV